MLAYHYSKSDDLAKAVQYLKLSGNKAMSSYSNLEAYRFYRDAIGILKEMDETDQQKKDRIDVILSMAIPMRSLAYPEDSIKFLEEGERLCKELEDKKSLAIIHNFWGSFYSAKGDAALGMKYQEESLEEAEKIQDSEMIARMGSGVCLSFDIAGEYRKIVDVAPRVIFVLEKTQTENEVSRTSIDLYSLQGLYGHALGYVGRFVEGERVCKEALSLAKKTNNLYLIGYAEFMYGCLLLGKGDGKNSVNHLQSAIGYLEKANAFFLPVLWGFLGLGYVLLGDFSMALRCIEKGHKMHLDIGLPYFLSIYHRGLSQVHSYLGNLNEAKVHAEQGLNLAQTNHERYAEGIMWLQLGRIVGKMEGSQLRKAEEHLLKGMKILDELETKPACAQSYLFLGELYADAGQKEKAIENLKKAEAMYQEMGMDYWLARTKELLEKIRI